MALIRVLHTPCLPAGSWKSGPQPFEVAEGGVYLVNVYYNRCSCGKTRTKACEEKRHPYTNVSSTATRFH